MLKKRIATRVEGLNQSTIQAGASFELDINRRTKINTNSSTNLGDAIIDTRGNVLTWYGSLRMILFLADFR